MSSPQISKGSVHTRFPRSHAVTADKTSVLSQLDRILSSPLFNNSKRCRPLLKYIVTETINGRGEQLKERSIGIDVFGRRPDYDTNEDRIVRAAAIDLRRRIAQYYQDPEHVLELRIEVHSGSYIPSFLAPAESQAQSGNKQEPADLRGLALPSQDGDRAMDAVSPARTKTRWILLMSPACLAAVIAVGIWVHALVARDPIDVFWAPMLRSDKIIVVLGNEGNPSSAGSAIAGSAVPSFSEAAQSDRVAFDDSLAAARIATLLGAHGKAIELRRGGAVTLRDMRESPTVIIGALSNPWALTLQQKLRYQFMVDESARALMIFDQKDPSHPLWKVDWATPYPDLKEDRAIVSRFIDLHTEQPVLLIAGLGRDGTAAAAEFVTNPAFLRTLMEQAPKTWDGNNVQAVIATDIVNGHDGVPHLVTTYYW